MSAGPHLAGGGLRLGGPERVQSIRHVGSFGCCQSFVLWVDGVDDGVGSGSARRTGGVGALGGAGAQWHGCDQPAAGGAGGAADFAAGRQRHRCGRGDRGGAGGGRADDDGDRRRYVRHRPHGEGRAGGDQWQRVFAGGGRCRVLSRAQARADSDARSVFGERSRGGGRLGHAAREIRHDELRRGAGAGDRICRERLSGFGDHRFRLGLAGQRGAV